MKFKRKILAIRHYTREMTVYNRNEKGNSETCIDPWVAQRLPDLALKETKRLIVRSEYHTKISYCKYLAFARHIEPAHASDFLALFCDSLHILDIRNNFRVRFL